MGFPNWGTDTGGYYQFKQRDVFARWLEFSAFCPIMEIGGALRIGNGVDGPHAPWDMPTEPQLRRGDDRHLPLLHVAASRAGAVRVQRGRARASRTGHPIATPLVFEYPDDPAVGDMWDEYLYGPWLLVAPVWRDGDAVALGVSAGRMRGPISGTTREVLERPADACRTCRCRSTAYRSTSASGPSSRSRWSTTSPDSAAKRRPAG